MNNTHEKLGEITECPHPEVLECPLKVLGTMPVELWHLWILWVVDLLSKYTTEEDYQAFLARLALVARFKHGSWRL